MKISQLVCNVGVLWNINDCKEIRLRLVILFLASVTTALPSNQQSARHLPANQQSARHISANQQSARQLSANQIIEQELPFNHRTEQNVVQPIGMRDTDESDLNSLGSEADPEFWDSLRHLPQINGRLLRDQFRINRRSNTAQSNMFRRSTDDQPSKRSNNDVTEGDNGDDMMQRDQADEGGEEGEGGPIARLHDSLPRSGRCLDDQIFEDCFLCGKIVSHSRVYHGCCDNEQVAVEFCHKMLS